ncbi:citrate transporter [Legionella sainthelensi]|uniref:Citrate transporter n=1 Tax=Legionella sainthelensi TaxID=28087 RepID=A0A0W0YEI6_9GAMM|nr:SLC13 family permease [Legionella sainthelensi]KTD55259.1 citrate transporter [Legionella sainthelensi]VEH37301.1 citrate transporter [Legionella sainthelensi]
MILPTQLQPYSVILILLISMIFFIWNKWSYAITAIFALAAAVILGAVPADKTFAGLNNPAVITVASIMIATNIIAKSNALKFIINKFEMRTQSLEVFSFSIFIAFISAFLNDIGALGLVLPVSIYTSLKYNRSPSYILMPIAMASLMGGMVTLIGTASNLIISNFRAQSLGKPFSMFDFSYVGFFTALIGVLFISFLGWRLLPKQRVQKTSFKPIYTIEIRIPPKSKWIGKTVGCFKEEIELLAEIVGLIRRKRKINLQESTEIKSGDRFIIQATLTSLEELSNSIEIVISNFIRKGSKNKSNDILLEAIVPTKSNIIDKKIKETNLRAAYKISFIAISKATSSKIGRIRNIIIEPGDMVLLHCKDPTVIDALPSYGLIPIETSTLQLNMGFKNFIPLIIFTIAILLSGLMIMPVQIVFAAAALLMILIDNTALAYVYKQFDWSVIIFLVAIIPLGDALTQTGGADLLAQLILKFSQHLSAFWVIALLIGISMCIANFIHNVATVIVMAPIAISLATFLKIPVDPLLMAVAIGSSCAVLTPIGHQNNLLVMGPGRYKFLDYMRLGLPLEIIVLVVATPLIYWIWYLK